MNIPQNDSDILPTDHSTLLPKTLLTDCTTPLRQSSTLRRNPPPPTWYEIRRSSAGNSRVEVWCRTAQDQDWRHDEADLVALSSSILDPVPLPPTLRDFELHCERRPFRSSSPIRRQSSWSVPAFAPELSTGRSRSTAEDTRRQTLVEKVWSTCDPPRMRNTASRIEPVPPPPFPRRCINRPVETDRSTRNPSSPIISCEMPRCPTTSLDAPASPSRSLRTDPPNATSSDRASRNLDRTFTKIDLLR